jgi:nitrite reductase (NADH) large subunit
VVRFARAAHAESKGGMKIVVIGNGMVGQRFLEQLAARGEARDHRFCEEPRPAYDRVQLTSFFSGKTAPT